ncbi:hypothetical protein GCM10020219_079470 [Nonomuraea dietziae]
MSRDQPVAGAGGKGDLAVAYHFDGPLPDSSGLRWTPLMDDPMSVVLPPRHPLAGRAEPDLAELAAESWVIGCTRTEGFLRTLRGHGGVRAAASRAATTDYFLRPRPWWRTGLGVTLVPELGLDPGARGPHPRAGQAAPPGQVRRGGRLAQAPSRRWSRR